MTRDLNGQKFITYHYTFAFPDKHSKEFLITLDTSTLDVVQPRRLEYPEWMKLNFNQCPRCSLEVRKNEYCPVAISLYDPIECFRDQKSYDPVEVSISTKERQYILRTTLQKGLSSLIGVFMVTSGCPAMEKLKPMVRFHLPFATEEETKYRAMSMYLLAQFFVSRHGKTPDWELRDLVSLYEDVRMINKSFTGRLMGTTTEDASINAVVILDCFADSIAFSITEDMLGEIEGLFGSYLK